MGLSVTPAEGPGGDHTLVTIRAGEALESVLPELGTGAFEVRWGVQERCQGPDPGLSAAAAGDVLVEESGHGTPGRVDLTLRGRRRGDAVEAARLGHRGSDPLRAPRPADVSVHGCGVRLAAPRVRLFVPGTLSASPAMAVD